jgi:hypothetical protein
VIDHRAQKAYDRYRWKGDLDLLCFSRIGAVVDDDELEILVAQASERAEAFECVVKAIPVENDDRHLRLGKDASSRK